MTTTNRVELAISTSLRELSIALRHGTTIHDIKLEQRGASLHEAIASLCAEHDTKPSDIRTIHVDRGPGSYTGLRIAVTFARFMGRFAHVELRACSSFELIAAALGPTDTPTTRIGLDARRGRVHTAVIEHATPIRLLEPPHAITIEDFLTTIDPAQTLVLDPSLQPSLQSLPRPPLPTPTYGARDLFHPSVQTEPITPTDLEPHYLMGSYAD